MRVAYTVLFCLLIISILACYVEARRSNKPIAPSVARLMLAIIPPVVGNLVLIASSVQLISTIGYYIYFLGMDAVVFFLFRFSLDYCNIQWQSKTLRSMYIGVLVADVVQFALNPFLGHAFGTEAIIESGYTYWRLIPYWGQTYHRIVCYGLLFAVIFVFIVKIVKSPGIYRERYLIVLITLIITAVWEAFYIISRTPIDRAMVGFAVFGMTTFYFAIHYRSTKVLDRILAQYASSMQGSIFIFDISGICIWANGGGMDLAKVTEFSFDQARDSLEFLFGDIDLTDKDWNAKRVIGVGSDASYYTLEKHSTMDRKGNVTGSILSVRDTTEDQRELQREMYNATHDTLTGLYTREFLYECISKKLASGNKEYMIIYIDANNFKIINDVFGSDFGNKAIKSIAEWIKARTSKECMFGRLGGDVFGVFMPKAEFNREKCEEDLAKFSVSDGTASHPILLHAGLYDIDESDNNVSVMFDRAHLALLTIKNEYHIHTAYYDDKIREKVMWDQHISNQLSKAIKERQLRPYLQAIVDRSGTIVGAEALVRWIHPEDGFLSPGAFIPVFEQNGMIIEVDRYMWRCACEILARWRGIHDDIFISVNISPKDFYFIDVASELRALVKEFDIDPARLRIEITETVMMNDADNRMDILRELREAGFIVEMDDFGSGYSSLNLLKEMPVDVLKIDMNFLNRSSDQDKAQTIVNSIIKLSEDLGVASLTEGVETVYQFHKLSSMGCKLFQGYYFSKPIPLEEFEEMLG